MTVPQNVCEKTAKVWKSANGSWKKMFESFLSFFVKGEKAMVIAFGRPRGAYDVDFWRLASAF